MGWLKGILFEEQPEFEKKKNEVPVQTLSTPMAQTRVGGFSMPTAPANPGVVNYGTQVSSNPQIREQLVTSIKAVVDPKYAQFKGMNDSLKPVLADSKQRFTAAFLAVKNTTGVTKTQLVQGAQVMLEALKKEQSSFENEMKTAMNQLDTAANAKVSVVQDLVKKKQEQIQQLTEEINKVSAEQMSTLSSIDAQRAEISKTQAEFMATEAELERELTTEINDLATYITE